MATILYPTLREGVLFPESRSKQWAPHHSKQNKHCKISRAQKEDSTSSPEQEYGQKMITSSMLQLGSFWRGLFRSTICLLPFVEGWQQEPCRANQRRGGGYNSFPLTALCHFPPMQNFSVRMDKQRKTGKMNICKRVSELHCHILSPRPIALFG